MRWLHRLVCCQSHFFVYLLKSEISIKEMKIRDLQPAKL